MSVAAGRTTRAAPAPANRSAPRRATPRARTAVAPPRPTAEPEVEERRGARARGTRLTEETGALGRREALAVGERGRPAVQVPAAQIGHATRSTVDRREPDVRAEHDSARAG